MAEEDTKPIPRSILSPLLLYLYPMSDEEREFLRRWIDLADPDAEHFSSAEFLGYASGLKEIAATRSVEAGTEAEAILLKIVKDLGRHS